MSTIDAPDPVILITNESTVLSDEALQAIMPAMQRQIDEHFYPAWGWRANLVFGAADKPAMRVIMRDTSDAEGLLGYHYKEGTPITYVFAKDDIASEGEFTSTLSHELLEMIADPNANLYARGPVPVRGDRRRMAWVGYEVCDPVEALLYEVDGVKVCDFVTPEYFEFEHKRRSVKFDHLGVLDRPFSLAPGGYLDVQFGARVTTLWGKAANKRKARHRRVARAAKGA